MIDRLDRLREMLHRRGDRIHSNLTISDIRDAGLRSHRHPIPLVGPVLVAASVVIVVVVVALTGRPGTSKVPPAGPGPGVSVTTPGMTTAPHTTVPSATRTVTTSAAAPASRPASAVATPTPPVSTAIAVTSTVRAGP